MFRIEFQGLLGFSFLEKAEQCIENNHRQNDRRVEPQADHQLDEARAKQNIDEDVIELLQEPHERPLLAALRQPVMAILLEPLLNIGRRQAGLNVGVETAHDLIRCNSMPRRDVAR